MTPDQAIAALDRAIATAGEDIELRHMAGGSASSTENLRAFVRG